MDRRIAVQLVPAKDGEHDADDRRARHFPLPVARGRRALERGVVARMLERVAAIDVGRSA